MNKKEIAIINEQSLQHRVYIVRGIPVMFDYDLAEIYGYTTKAFNQQVKNNIQKFPGEFRFQLSSSEVEELTRSNILTAMQTAGVKGGRTSRPYAFTEQGVYMLMTVLKGDLATKQSLALVRLFKGMKDYLIESQPLISQKGYAALIEQVEEHSADIREIKENMISKAELSDFMKIFDNSRDAEEVLILDGQPFKADVAYQKIYRKAKKNIIVIDDYLGVKTLHHLVSAKKSVELIIISDNKGRQPLRKTEYDDFVVEYPDRDISFIKTADKAHDRYIVLDNATKDMKVYHCGASSKDAGKRITTISEMKDIDEYKKMISNLLKHPVLSLK